MSSGCGTAARVRAARDLKGFLRTGSVTGGRGAAAAVLDGLRTVAPFDCAHLLEWDAAAARHVALADVGFPVEVTSAAEQHLHLEALFDRMVTAPVATLRWQDIPVRDRHGGIYHRASVDQPGYSDGLTLRLWACDGRPVGAVNMSAFNGSLHDDLTVDLLDLLAPHLATLFDPVPRLWPLTAELADGRSEGVVVHRTGRRRALTAGAEVDLARPDGSLWPTIRPVADGSRTGASAVVLAGDRVLAVSVYAGEREALLLHRTIPAPFGLSTRELQILAALAGGATNGALASRFGIAPRTVATYVERLLSKTGCPNRTAAARLATRLNLVV